jgi:hypothetical protein
VAVGSWGTAIFSNDTAADVRAEFRELIAQGLAAEQATARLVELYGVGNDADVDNDFWLALAASQHALGRRTSEAVSQARRVIDDPDEIARWRPGDQLMRRTALDRLRRQLDSPPPPARSVRRSRKVDTSLRAGQHVVVEIGHGLAPVLLRVVYVNTDKGGRYPVAVALRWQGSEQELHRAHRLDPLPDTQPGRLRPDEALGFVLSSVNPPTPTASGCWTCTRTRHLPCPVTTRHGSHPGRNCTSSSPSA